MAEQSSASDPHTLCGVLIAEPCFGSVSFTDAGALTVLERISALILFRHWITATLGPPFFAPSDAICSLVGVAARGADVLSFAAHGLRWKEQRSAC